MIKSIRKGLDFFQFFKLQEEREEDETRRYDKHLAHQSRVDRLNQDKEELQRQLDLVEAEANRRIGQLEAERERLLAKIDAKDAEIAQQASELDENRPIEVQLDPAFHDPSGTSSFTILPSLEIPVSTAVDIDAFITQTFAECDVDAVLNALKEADIDLDVFEFADEHDKKSN